MLGNTCNGTLMIDLGVILGMAVPELTLFEETTRMSSVTHVLLTTQFQTDLAMTSFTPTVVMILPTVMMVTINFMEDSVMEH